LLETVSERRSRELAAGSSRFRVEQTAGHSLVVIDLCTELQERVTATTSNFSPENLTVLVRVTWPGTCKPSAEQVEFSFAKLVALEAQPVTHEEGSYLVRLPLELVDAYSTSQVLGNIWLRLDRSPGHWVATVRAAVPAPGPGDSFLRRSTEIDVAPASLVVPGLGDLDLLVGTLMASHGIEHYTSELVPSGGHSRLRVADNETDFVYLEKELIVVGDIGAAGLASASLYPRADPRNEAVVFTLEFDERLHPAVSQASYLCEVSSGAAP